MLTLSAFLFLGFGDFVLESKVETLSGLFERYVHSEDERAYKVRRTDRSKVQSWVEDESKDPGRSQRLRPQFLGSSDAALEMVLVQENGKWKLWDTSARVFEKDSNRECSALSRLDYPTPLHQPEIFIMGNLKCAEPLTTESDSLLVWGRYDENFVDCEGKDICWWRSKFEAKPEATVQKSVMTFLWRTEGELLLSGIDAFLPKVTAHSWFGDSNRSLYDAQQKSLFYGAGSYVDGLDGFIVSHEWAHFLIDQLNPGLVGFGGQVIHEAFADFFAANLYNSACVAPFDAQEVSGRECLRNLENQNKVPDDLSGRDKYHTSLIFSGALWEVRKFFPPPLMNELIVETIIRLPKKPDLAKIWSLMSRIQKTMIAERILLKNTSEDFLEVGRRRGLLE